jgi:hypothetical protein
MRRRTLLLALALAGLGVQLFAFRRYLQDDAYISLRYARNLLEGHGLVFNPGERVEGYTNFLWILQEALLGFLGVDLVFAAQLLGCAYAAGILVLLVFFPRGGAGAPSSAGVAALLVAANACIGLWALGGLEACGAAFFVLLADLLAREEGGRGRKLLLGLASGLALLTRPDTGVLLVGVAALQITRAVRGRRASAVLLPLAAAVGVVAPWLVWKIAYYGALLPNTLLAKGELTAVTLTHGREYLALYLSIFGWPLVLVPLCFFRGPNRIWCVATLVGVACFGAWIVRVGGDHMVGFRFLVPAIPLLALLVEEALGRELLSSRVRHLPVVVGVLAVLLVAWSSFRSFQRATARDGAAFWGEQAGRWARKSWPKESLVALNTAGSTPFYSRHAIVDMLGLVDPVIARREVGPARLPLQQLPGHGKGDGAYVLSRRPDYVVIGPATGCDPATGQVVPWFLSDLELLESAEFRRLYRQRTVFIPLDPEEVAYYVPFHEKVDRMRFVYFERRRGRRGGEDDGDSGE